MTGATHWQGALAPVLDDQALGVERCSSELGLDPVTHLSPDVRTYYRFVLGLLADQSTLEWIGPRWNPARRMFTWEGTDHVKGVCWVPACRRQRSRRSILCVTCSQEFETEHGAAPWEAEATDVRLWGQDHGPTYRSGRCSVTGPDGTVCARAVAVRALCSAHHASWTGAERQRVPRLSWEAAQTPFPPGEPCAVGCCGRPALRASSRTPSQQCCGAHAIRWRQALGTGQIQPGQFRLWAAGESPTDISWLGIWFKDTPAVLVAEVLWSIHADRVGRRVHPCDVTGMLAQSLDGSHRRLAELDTSTLSPSCLRIHRRWLNRLELLEASPEKEWDRDVVRLTVVHPDAEPKMTLDFTGITQPWLERLTREVVRSRSFNLTPTRLRDYVSTTTRLSVALQCRPDGGMDPRVLDERAAREALSVLLSGTRSIGSSRIDVSILKVLLDHARHLGIADRLRGSFRFELSWLAPPTETYRSADEVSFPDATFAFLLGMDHLLGPAVLDLLRSVPHDPFSGDVAVAAVHLVANYGRRPNEVYQLTAGRLRADDGGGAALRYHDFKNRKDGVWLPIDQRSTLQLLPWVERLQIRYPNTPTSELALLPAPQKNPRGVLPLSKLTMAMWFRSWVTLLEQAIVLGRLHQATGKPVDELLQFRWREPTDGRLDADRHPIPVDDETWRLLVDYRAGLRAGRRTKGRDPWVFTSPFTRSGPMAATEPARFDALGPGWLTTVLGYESPGIPGTHLGREAIPAWALEIRRFRHTYLQQLIDAGSDPLVVQELAGHAHIGTTIDHYVRPRQAMLREAVDLLAGHRRDRFGTKTAPLTLLPSATDVITNTCSNPQVLSFDKAGCDHGGLCYGCPHFGADPSNLLDIDVQVQTLGRHATRIEAVGVGDRSPQDDARLLTLHQDIEGWSRVAQTLRHALDRLDNAERDRVNAACRIVRSTRNSIRYGTRSGSGQVRLDEGL